MKLLRPFFAQLRYRFINWRINREIFERIFPHLRGDRNFGYPFQGQDEMDAKADALDVHALLDEIETHIANMPGAYGKSFRYVMHRNLHEEFRRYEHIARSRVQAETCDPRVTATHA